ncbi:MAG TPA: propanoyl-CoA acyltransferase [Spirochaetia bacterium]|nr:MAG: hypothetical protein A2Y41_06170 [Spirochaetes bacterium GWB1_36_13]HCL57849.1 propanoyl-CoA acyltransferase [Spirochaetia bacterium]
MSKVSIIGAYNTEFGSFVKRNKETGEITDLKSFYDLLIEAGQGAIKDSGLSAKDIDAVWFGSCSPSRFVNQEHIAPLGVEIDPALRFKPMTRSEAACASSSVALYDAVYAIESGRYKNILVVGVEKMNLLGTKDMTATLAASSYFPEEGAKGMTFPGLFAEYAKGYQKFYNLSDEELRKMLATVAALGYLNAAENPLAHQKNGPKTAAEILGMPDEGKGSNPMIAFPLRLHDCSLVTDGAAAMVITTTENAKAMKKSKIVEIAGIGHAEEFMPISKRTNMHELLAAKEAVKKSFAEAKISTSDLDLAEVHDCFTINQLLCTEALGLSKDGKAGYDYMDGKFTRTDKCPVNISGGLKAKGHPVGATGASMHTLIYKQLVGDPIGAVPTKGQPEIGVTLNVGGSAATNCVTVLRRVK